MRKRIPQNHLDNILGAHEQVPPDPLKNALLKGQILHPEKLATSTELPNDSEFKHSYFPLHFVETDEPDLNIEFLPGPCEPLKKLEGLSPEFSLKKNILLTFNAYQRPLTAREVLEILRLSAIQNTYNSIRGTINLLNMECLLELAPGTTKYTTYQITGKGKMILENTSTLSKSLNNKSKRRPCKALNKKMRNQYSLHLTGIQQKALETVLASEEPLNAWGVGKVADILPTTIYNLLRKLCKQGLLEKLPNAYYQASSELRNTLKTCPNLEEAIALVIKSRREQARLTFQNPHTSPEQSAKL